MDWFEKLTGFQEENPNQVRANLRLEGDTITSLVNGNIIRCGELEVVSLSRLREISQTVSTLAGGRLEVSEIIGDVQQFHLFPENAGALFQAASQFNLLEMVGPHVTPESGVGKYEYDRTQGPACAIACGAGTIYRNYFAPVNGRIGQTKTQQIDTLDEIGRYFNNEERLLWRMQNGYALANKDGLDHISSVLDSINRAEYENVKAKLKVGIQWDTTVTISDRPQVVSQVYCSALPVAYSQVADAHWESFARLILRATYEATFWAAIKNHSLTGNNRLLLTLVGGGAFGNHPDWIVDAILENLRRFKDYDLDVRFVSYGGPSPVVQQVLTSFEKD